MAGENDATTEDTRSERVKPLIGQPKSGTKLSCLKCGTKATGLYTQADVEFSGHPGRYFTVFLCRKCSWSDLTGVISKNNETTVRYTFNIEEG